MLSEDDATFFSKELMRTANLLGFHEDAALAELRLRMFETRRDLEVWRTWYTKYDEIGAAQKEAKEGPNHKLTQYGYEIAKAALLLEGPDLDLAIDTLDELMDCLANDREYAERLELPVSEMRKILQQIV